MKHLVIGIAAAITIAAIGPASAQVPPPPVVQQVQYAAPPGWPGYPLNAVTPEDAYRQHLINRWDYERLEGPLPQALQGPSANGEGSDSAGGSRQ
jgi:hypothetical protein